MPRSAPRPAARTPQPETRAAPPRPSDEPDLPGAPIDQRFAFETFVVGKPNELAHAAARRVGEFRRGDAGAARASIPAGAGQRV